MYPTSFPGLGHGRRAVSGAGSVTAADVGLILDCAFTGALTFAAAATLGNQFQVAFYVSSGTVTLTGNGAETIQSPTGSANTFVLTAGQGAYVSCDGTGLKVILGVGLAPAPATTITTTTIQAATSAGIAINNSSGTQVMLIGPGPGTGVTFAGGVNVTGGTLTVTTADINGGTLDGVVIGGNSAAAATVTTLTATTATVNNPGTLSQVTVGSSVAGGYSAVVMHANGTNRNWLFGAQYNVGGAFEITPSTANGGTTFTTPVVTLTSSAITLAQPVTCSSTLSVSGRISAGVTSNTSGLYTGAFDRVVASPAASGVYRSVSAAYTETGTGSTTHYAQAFAFDGNITGSGSNAGYDRAGQISLYHRGNGTRAEVTGAYYEVGTYNGGSDSTGTITNLYGIRVSQLKTTSSTITTSYGLKIEDILGTTKYAIYTGAGAVRFGDAVTCSSTLTVSGTTSVSSAGLATTATDGFLYIPSCAGTPTGTPTTISNGVPIVVDRTNNKLYFYSGGAWRDAGP